MEINFTNFATKLVQGLYSFINNYSQFKVKRHHPDAIIPIKGDTGYDVFSVEEITILPKQRIFVSTGISTEISKGFYIRIAPVHHLVISGIDVGIDTIPSSHREIIKILLINNGNSKIFIKKGLKIAHFILEHCYDVRIDITDKLSDMENGYIVLDDK